ncbi:hypothetical protein [Brasilonema bromeliae]|uniref:hypothetical protein n=1 Tax=Brasilonema bromeliae TaxID=383615 RepID=UPI001FE6BE0F|nr:hypothetical protein [Brasilonema bromeliae]
MPMITWELWLARDIVRPARMRRFPAVGDWRTRRVADNPLPWQKSIDKLTPGRVAQAMGGILLVLLHDRPNLAESHPVGLPDKHDYVGFATQSSKKVRILPVNDSHNPLKIQNCSSLRLVSHQLSIAESFCIT